MGELVDLEAWKAKQREAEWVDLFEPTDELFGYYGLELRATLLQTSYPVECYSPPLAPLIDILTAEQSPSLPAQPEDPPVRAAAQVLDWFDRQP